MTDKQTKQLEDVAAAAERLLSALDEAGNDGIGGGWSEELRELRGELEVLRAAETKRSRKM